MVHEQCDFFGGSRTRPIRCVGVLGHGPFSEEFYHNFEDVGPLSASASEPAVAELRVQRWTYDGVVLDTNDMGEISLDELKEFVACVERLDAAEFKIRLHAFGLRATRLAGKSGPYLDWRD